LHGLNSVNGADDIDDVSDTVVDGVVDKPTIGVVGRCCDKDDGTKPWIGSAHNMANRKVVIMVLGLRCLIMNSLHPSSRHLHHDNLARSLCRLRASRRSSTRSLDLHLEAPGSEVRVLPLRVNSVHYRCNWRRVS